MKYELTEESINHFGDALYRIIALKDFGDIKKGELGGFIKSLDNLSQYDNAWVSGSTLVSDNARVSGNAMVSGTTIVSGNAVISGTARVSGNVRVSDNARVYDNALVSGNASVYGVDTIIGSIVINLINACAFNVTASKKDDYIRVGCRSHSLLEWQSYIESEEWTYLQSFKNELEHEKCLLIIQSLINLFEME